MPHRLLVVLSLIPPGELRLLLREDAPRRKVSGTFVGTEGSRTRTVIIVAATTNGGRMVRKYND